MSGVLQNSCNTVIAAGVCMEPLISLIAYMLGVLLTVKVVAYWSMNLDYSKLRFPELEPVSFESTPCPWAAKVMS